MKSGREPFPESPGRRDWWGEVGVVVLLILLISLPRLVRLTADPAPDLSSAALYDEGGWAQNARQHALFGQWVMDENNAGFTAAPLYTFALAGVYAVLGVGFFSTRLLTALSGILCCLLFYGFLRTRHTRGRAAAVALVLGLGYSMLSHNRVALTETFQLLFLMGTAGFALLADRRPAWSLAAGACFGATILVKPSAFFFLLVLVLFWALRRRRIPYREVALLGAGTGAVLAAAALVVVLPHWDIVRQQLEISFRTAFSPGESIRARMELMWWSGLGLPFHGFFRHTALPLLAVTLLAAARLGRSRRSNMEVTELLCWTWLVVGLLALGIQRYQPERRFLVLLPPLAFLGVTACRAGGITLPTRENLGEAGLAKRVIIGALLGGYAGFYLGPSMADSLRGRTLVWNIAILVGAGLVAWGAGRIPRRPVRFPAAVFIAGFLLLEPARFAWTLLHPTYSVIQASRTIASYEGRLPPGRHAITGLMGRSLALETGLFAFQARDQGRVGASTNLDGMTRFNPEFALVVLPFSERGAFGRQLAAATERGFASCHQFHLWPDRQGNYRWFVALLARPGACRPAAAE